MTTKRNHKKVQPVPHRSSAQPEPKNDVAERPANTTRADTPEKGEESIRESPWSDRRYEDE